MLCHVMSGYVMICYVMSCYFLTSFNLPTSSWNETSSLKTLCRKNPKNFSTPSVWKRREIFLSKIIISSQSLEWMKSIRKENYCKSKNEVANAFDKKYELQNLFIWVQWALNIFFMKTTASRHVSYIFVA